MTALLDSEITFIVTMDTSSCNLLMRTLTFIKSQVFTTHFIYLFI